MERKLRTLLERHPRISSGNEIEEIDQNIQVVTTEFRNTKSSSILSIPSVYPGENYLPVNTENCLMSIIPRIHQKPNYKPSSKKLTARTRNYRLRLQR